MKMKNIFQKSPIVGIFQGGIAAVFLLVMMMQPLEAQLINNFGAWSAFVKSEGSNKVCYIGSTPNKQRGKYKKRGETYVLVTHRPAEKTRNVVSIKAGYVYKNGSDVTVNIGSQRFSLFTDKDFAWARDKAGDNKLVAAMRAGSLMITTGISGRGTKTTDTYSLSGFTAALNAINKACPSK
jgi:invasion protein IalB